MIPIAKPFLDKDDAQAAHDAVLSGWVTQGPRVQEFEEKFAAYTGSKYAVAVSNCTTALQLSLIVAGIGAGDEVICPSMSYIATANAIIHAGATPVFAEVIGSTYNMDAQHCESLITKRTKGILLVHQIGMPADIDAFRDLCRRKNLILIEDAACAAGSMYKGKKIGTHSELVCFSFHPRKVITTGDGGMITTNNEQYYNRLKLLRQHGMSVSDRLRHVSSSIVFEEHVEIGFNFRMTDIQAAVGISQLSKLDWLIRERRKIAAKYSESLKDISCIRLPQEPDDYFSNNQSYSIYLKKSAPVSRNELMQFMLDKGVATRRGIMTSHREIAYAERCKNISLPVSEDACDRSFLIPIFVPMKEEETDLVIASLRKILN